MLVLLGCVSLRSGYFILFNFLLVVGEGEITKPICVDSGSNVRLLKPYRLQMARLTLSVHPISHRIQEPIRVDQIKRYLRALKSPRE